MDGATRRRCWPIPPSCSRNSWCASSALPPASTPASAERDDARACATAASNLSASARGRPSIVSETETCGRLARPGEADAEAEAESGGALALAAAEEDAEAVAFAETLELADAVALAEALALADNAALAEAEAMDEVVKEAAASGVFEADAVADVDCKRDAVVDCDASSDGGRSRLCCELRGCRRLRGRCRQ